MQQPEGPQQILIPLLIVAGRRAGFLKVRLVPHGVLRRHTISYAPAR
jgi:hypothetical protein